MDKSIENREEDGGCPVLFLLELHTEKWDKQIQRDSMGPPGMWHPCANIQDFILHPVPYFSSSWRTADCNSTGLVCQIDNRKGRESPQIPGEMPKVYVPFLCWTSSWSWLSSVSDDEDFLFYEYTFPSSPCLWWPSVSFLFSYFQIHSFIQWLATTMAQVIAVPSSVLSGLGPLQV